MIRLRHHTLRSRLLYMLSTLIMWLSLTKERQSPLDTHVCARLCSSLGKDDFPLLSLFLSVFSKRLKKDIRHHLVSFKQASEHPTLLAPLAPSISPISLSHTFFICLFSLSL